MKPCPFQSRLSAYHDYELTELEARQVEMHVGACPDCRDELEQLQDVSSVLGMIDASDDLTEAELATMHQAVAGEPQTWAVLQPLIAIAASVLVICGVWIAALPAPTAQAIATSATNDTTMPDWQRLAMTLHADVRVSPDGAVAAVGQEPGRVTNWIVDNLTSSN